MCDEGHRLYYLYIIESFKLSIIVLPLKVVYIGCRMELVS